MLAGRFDFTGLNSIVQGKTLRVRIRLTDAAGDPLPVGLYEFRAMFKKDFDSDPILFLSTNDLLPGLTADSEIVLEPDDPETGDPMPGTIELVVSDEVMEGILHTAWTEQKFAGAPSKWRGVWELEAEEADPPGDTIPLLAGKVNFVREAVR